jgi:1,4-dihydroxy-2-naphthoate octaprenyltransferase
MKKWLRAIGFYRGFLLVSLIPVSLGAAVAWQQEGIFHLPLFALTLVAVWFFHAGTNLLNDYYDHVSGADDNNPVKTPFSGGTLVIQEGLLPPEQIKIAGRAAFAVGGLLFIWLSALTGWPMFFLAVFGFLAGFLYTTKPVWLAYRGWGELMIGLAFGPALVATGAYTQCGRISAEALLIGVLVGLWAAAIITINEIPDYVADRTAGKRTLVVRFGPQFGLTLWASLLYLSVALLIGGIFVGVLPPQMVIAMLVALFVVRLTEAARRGVNKLEDLVALCGNTIRSEVIFWALLLAGLLSSRLLETV